MTLERAIPLWPKKLKVDSLKIDKCFIDKLLDPDLDRSITSDIISMAHKLGHYTIAEGVEHANQLQYLKKHGCDKIQGFLIIRPLDEEVALDFLHRSLSGSLTFGLSAE